MSWPRRNKYSNHDVSNHSGLYFENKGSVRIINTKWTLLTYVNLTTYNEQEKIFDSYLNAAKDYCVENEIILTQKNIICNNFKLVVKQYVKEILDKRAIILKSLGHRSQRNRRGVIDGVGNIANILFGVCDSTCTESNNRNIIQLQQSGTTSLNILKEQTRVVKKVVVEAEQSFRDITFLQTKITDFIQASRTSADFLSNHTMELEHKTRIQDTYLLLNLLPYQYAFETNYISEMINVARLG